jgi:type II secretory pathway component PulJ
MELLVVLALLGVVLAGTYQFFFFAQSSWDRTAAEARAVQEARLVLLGMDNEVRQARKPNAAREAVEVIGTDRLDIYSDVTGDGRPEMVSYRLVDGRLERREVASPDTAFPYSYGNPDTWATVIAAVANTAPFAREGSPPRYVVRVSLDVDDAVAPLIRPVPVRAELTVRSRGEAP